MLAWILAHQALCAALGVSVLDFVFAIVPSTEANGVIHWVYLALKGKASPPAA